MPDYCSAAIVVVKIIGEPKTKDSFSSPPLCNFDPKLCRRRRRRFSPKDKDKDKDVVATAEVPEMSTCSDAERTHFLEQLTAGADALRVASTAIQNDHSSVFAAVSQSGWALAWASPALRARREIVMAAVSI